VYETSKNGFVSGFRKFRQKHIYFFDVPYTIYPRFFIDKLQVQNTVFSTFLTCLRGLKIASMLIHFSNYLSLPISFILYCDFHLFTHWLITGILVNSDYTDTRNCMYGTLYSNAKQIISYLFHNKEFLEKDLSLSKF
jgi:hypothetical protein